MFSKIVDQKASKLKFNVDGYLSNDRKRQPSQVQNPMNIRREHPPSGVPPVNPSGNQMPQPIKLPDPEVKSLTIHGKTIQNLTVMLKPTKKQKQIHIYFTQQSSKFKLQIKTIPQNGFQVRRDLQKGIFHDYFRYQIVRYSGILQFQFKRAQKKKSFKEENNPQIKWMSIAEVKDEKVTLVMNNKQYLKNVYKILLEGLINEDQIKNFEEAKTGQQKHIATQQILEQDRGDDDIVKFTMPTQQQLNETQKFRKSIKDMKEDQKLYIMTDIFKIKKEYEDLDKKRFKCPVFGCQKNEKFYREATQLKTHIKKSHPELTKHGIEVTEFGTFQYSQKALDLALYLGKVFPGEMKKIIKKMKTKQPNE